jgi:hypothetical protein
MSTLPSLRRSGARAIAVLTTAAMLTLMLPAAAAALEHGFTNYREVPNNACDLGTPQAGFPDRGAAPAAHRRSIDCVADQGIAQGRDGRYHPQESVTRGQMASFIARTLDAAGDRTLPQDPDSRFADTDGSPHERRIDQLAEIGVVQGRGDDRYDPEGLVTRAQMASFVVRAATWNHDHQYAPAGDGAYFLDIEGDTHQQAIRTGYELWLFEGRAPGEYDPGLTVQRATMATFLTRLLDLVHPNIYRTDNQTYMMSPAEPMAAPTGEPVEFSVDASRAEYTDGLEPMPGPVRQALDIVLFPCSSTQWQDPPATFAGGPLAEDFAGTDTGAAYISSVNGEPVQGRERLHRSATPQDGRITFTVVSPAGQPDCTVAVAFDNRAPAEELRLDAGNRPTAAYGFVVASWDDDTEQARPFVSPGTTETEPADGSGLGLVEVRTGQHHGFDRVVLQLDGEGTVGWRVEYTDDPRYAGSGHPVEVDGEATLSVVVEGVGYPNDTGVPAYDGPDRLIGAGVSVEEVVLGNLFEGRQGVFVGTTDELPFRVFRLAGPERLVVDVAHGD